MPGYDTSFSPPAPVADVTDVHPATGARGGGLRGKLDSGADMTVIPETLVAQLGLSAKGHIWTRGYDGTYWLRPLYYVRLIVEGFDLYDALYHLALAQLASGQPGEALATYRWGLEVCSAKGVVHWKKR